MMFTLLRRIKLPVLLFLLFAFQNATADKSQSKTTTQAECESCETSAGNSLQKIKIEAKKIFEISCGLWTSGKASYYGQNDGFSGKKTASGQILKPNDLTAAHRSLPFGTLVKVRLPSTDREVIVRINDRGPFTPGRTIDLNYAAAKSIGLDHVGVGEVQMQVCQQLSQN